MNPTKAGPTVGDLMTSDPIVVRADEPLATAARLLDEHHISGLPVVDGTGRLTGVISQTDLLRARATEHLWGAWPGLSVRHLMSHPVITAHRGTSVDEAVRLMETERVHRLIVVDDDDRRPIGVLSTSDVVHQIAGALQRA